jgi:hypothetical protein
MLKQKLAAFLVGVLVASGVAVVQAQTGTMVTTTGVVYVRSISNVTLTNPTVTGNLRFSADNTYDIGSNGTTSNPRNVYVANRLIANRAFGDSAASPSVTVCQADGSCNKGLYNPGLNVLGFSVAGTGVMTLQTDSLRFVTDNATDIGGSGTARPRTGYFGTAVSAPQYRASSNVLYFTNSDDTDFFVRLTLPAAATPLMQFSGTTSSFPAIKRFGNALTLRQANDTVGAFAAVTACAAGGEGALVVVTDSNTATWGATVAGGGANRVLAYCNGTNWTVAGI